MTLRACRVSARARIAPAAAVLSLAVASGPLAFAWSRPVRPDRVGDAAVTWVRVPAGRFEMGCVPTDRDCRTDERPRHPVVLTRAFEMAATELTVDQADAWSRATGRRTPRQPSWNRGDTHPVVNITWEEAHDICGWLGGRLPTEAEWEYAARGGADGKRFPWGDELAHHLVNSEYAGHAEAWGRTAPVGSFPANGYGLFDMSGNVWEWTADWYSDSYGAGARIDPRGPADGSRKVVRGGSWDSSWPRLRVSGRFGFPPASRYNLYIGARCARDLPTPLSARSPRSPDR